jgi:hypothetical protein
MVGTPHLYYFFGREKKMFKKQTLISLICVVGLTAGMANAVQPVSQWEFNGNANDTFGLNNGTLMNGASIAADPVRGQVLAVNGYDQYVNCGNNSSLDVGSGSFTVMAWVKGQLSPEGVFAILTKGYLSNPYTGWDFEIFSWHDNLGWGTKLWTPTQTAAAAYYPFVTNTWYNVAAVRDATNSTVSYYINGQLASTLPYSNAANSNNSDLNIGKLSGASDQYFIGRIDDVKLYNNALTAEEVAAAVPEPATMLLLGTGVFLFRRSK